jgi:hypothetical protein
VRAVGVRLWSELRAGWRAWAALVLLIGVFSGGVIAAAAGARRTATAYPRMIEELGASHALVAAFNTGLEGYYREVARLPQAAETSVVAGLPIFPRLPSGEVAEFNGNALAPVSGGYGRSLDRPKLLAGRLPEPDQPREALINEVVARRFGLKVGSRFEMVAAHFAPGGQEGEPEALIPLTVNVVGVGRLAREVVPTTKLDSEEQVLMTPATYREYAEGHPLNFDGIAVRLRDGADMSAFRAAAERLASERAEEVGGDILFADNRDRDRRVERAIRPQAVALLVFAAFAGLAGLLVLGQALSRQLSEDATEVPVLRALGLTRAQLVGLALGRTAIVAGAAAALALVVAVALSPLFPIGAARRAELHEGLEVNLVILGAGAVAIVAVFLLRAALPAWRLASVPAGVQGTADITEARSSSFVARALQWAVVSPSAAAGVRMALEPGRGRTAVPVRTTLAGAVVGLAAVATTVTFAANLDRLVNTPRLYGRNWDVTIDASFGPIDRARGEEILRSTPGVSSWSGGYYGEATIGGRAVTAVGLDGDVTPTIVEGRAPRAVDEAVLGTSTLRHAGRRLGDRVEVVVGDEARSMTVVGRAVFPALGRGSFPQTGLGEGLLTSAAALEPPPDPSAPAPYYNFFLVNLRPGAGPGTEAALEGRLRALCPEDQSCESTAAGTSWLLGRSSTAERPAEIQNLDRIRWTPVLLAAVLGGLALATVAHTLVTSIRRRRRDLAVLKTMGFQRRQVSAAVAWQATTFAAVAAIIGLPLGIALGRVIWLALAHPLGIVPDVATPLVGVLLAGPAMVLIANLLALVPGWLAGRVPPAVVLRTE